MLFAFGEHALSMTVKDILTLFIITITPATALNVDESHDASPLRQLPVIADGRLAAS